MNTAGITYNYLCGVCGAYHQPGLCANATFAFTAHNTDQMILQELRGIRAALERLEKKEAA